MHLCSCLCSMLMSFTIKGDIRFTGANELDKGDTRLFTGANELDKGDTRLFTSANELDKGDMRFTGANG